MGHRLMKLAEVVSIFEDAFNLVMTDLNTLFQRAVDANIFAQINSEFIIRDPENIAIKGRPRERRIKSGVKKKSKKDPNKTSDDPSTKEKDKRPTKRQRTSPDEVVEAVQQISMITSSPRRLGCARRRSHPRRLGFPLFTHVSRRNI